MVILMKKGAFITFKGLDGSGKTTQFNAIRNMLTKDRYEHIGTKP